VRILIVDDDLDRRERLAAAIARGDPSAAVERATDAGISDVGPDLVVLGSTLADRSGLGEVLRRLTATHPDLPLISLSLRDAGPAVAALRDAAADYATRARRALPVPRSGPLAGLVGRSVAIEQVRELVRTAARTDAHVLIEGETGTGKEVVARAIHALGRRGTGPFVPVNCAAIPETLAESEFFGHARGAFTGTVQERPGVLHLADRGTLFLDEVEDLALALQAKLLRVVQDHEVRPLGASTARRVDVRIVSASNRDLAAMVEAGTFRRDLFYRLRVFAIHLPPLRQRREDLPVLIEHFVARFNRAQGTTVTVPGPTALKPLLEHAWPGNVRELENVLESLLVLAQAGGVGLAEVIGRRQTGAATFGDERVRILRVLDENRWNRQRAAAALGISRVTLWRRMERHGIRDPLGVPARETG